MALPVNSLQINLTARPSDILAPIVGVERILLIHIDFEKLVVARAFEVFVTLKINQHCEHFNLTFGSYSRVQLLVVRCNEVRFGDFNKRFLFIFPSGGSEVSLALKGTEVDLFDQLDDVEVAEACELVALLSSGLRGCLPREGGPLHEGLELRLMIEGSGPVRLSVGTTEEGGHLEE